MTIVEATNRCSHDPMGAYAHPDGGFVRGGAAALVGYYVPVALWDCIHIETASVTASEMLRRSLAHVTRSSEANSGGT
jgi:hypothetical protein